MARAFSWKLWTAFAGASLLALSGCDRTEERIDRAGSVFDAAIDQISGTETADPNATDMASVPLDARAFAGGDLVQAEAFVSDRPQALFAIGSIIAKPRDLPPLPTPTEALVMQSPPERASEIRALSLENQRPEIVRPEPIPAEPAPSIAEGTVQAPQINQAARRAIREAVTQDVLLPRNLPIEQERMARRAIPTERAIAVQTDARGVMLEKMSQFGLAGQVELNRTGQMVIQIGADGADPTQLSLPPQPERILPREMLFSKEGARLPNLPRMALNADWDCPEVINPDAMKANPVFATDCL
ncbi:MAG: hypothetical protein AAGJ28_25420, partial [Pseudomonadota bacterium]